MTVSGIYQIENQVNGKRYIGSAVNIKKRWREHLGALRRGRHHNQHLQGAYGKYGEEALGFTVLEQIEDSSQLIPREQHFLDRICPEYNILPTAGSRLGCRLSVEARTKISEAKRGQKRKPFSTDWRRNLSLARKGKQPFLGRRHSEQARKKLSAANIGKRNPNYGKHHSAETRRKMSEVQTGERNHKFGKHHSKETRRKMSEARKAWWRRLRNANG